ncbi:hypothetical protein H0H87_004361 [Tephrocybe sp. NHM501043]|nr:hypothetical protein H0H87_004361 [Tephrocybe sp. NHM501043]
MADVTDPKISQAYEDVRSDKSETNWLLLDYISDGSDKLQVTKTGTGGLAELREVLDDTKASYAYARVTYSNDKESTREKFILVVTIPVSSSDILVLTTSTRPAGVDWAEVQDHEKSKGTASTLHIWSCMSSYCDPRSQISVQSADVKTVLRVFSVEVPAQEKDDLKEDPIVIKLRKVCAIVLPAKYN